VLRRVLVVGNSGSGKSTLAEALARDERLAHLDLDTLAWLPTVPPARRDLSDSERDIRRFTARHEAWIVEGCYADLASMLVSDATELVFLNPGVDVCVRHCRARPWEPHKYATRAAQDANLAMLVEWVRSYPTRDDPCSLGAHRALYDAFGGPKREVRDVDEVRMDATPEQIAGARAYEALFVPSLIGPYAPIVADAAGIRPGDRVLDVACGTGVVTREALRRVGSAGHVSGLDANAGMLAVAREQGGEIAWHEGRAESLPFPDAAFDAVVCNFGVLHLGRPERAAAEAARVTAPGGRIALTVWDVPAKARLIGVFVDAMAAARAAPPADLPVGPPFFRFSDEAEFAALLTGAGYRDVAVATVAFLHPVPSAEALWDGLLGGTVRTGPSILGQPPEVRAAIRSAFDRLVAEHAAPDGALALPVSVKLASGRRPG